MSCREIRHERRAVGAVHVLVPEQRQVDVPHDLPALHRVRQARIEEVDAGVVRDAGSWGRSCRSTTQRSCRRLPRSTCCCCCRRRRTPPRRARGQRRGSRLSPATSTGSYGSRHTSRSGFLVARASSPASGASRILSDDRSRAKLVRTVMETRSEPENGVAAGAQLLGLRLLDDAVDAVALGRVEDAAVAEPERDVVGAARRRR